MRLRISEVAECGHFTVKRRKVRGLLSERVRSSEDIVAALCGLQAKVCKVFGRLLSLLLLLLHLLIHVLLLGSRRRNHWRVRVRRRSTVVEMVAESIDLLGSARKRRWGIA